MNINLSCARKACDQLGLSYKNIDQNGLLLEIELGTKKIHFVHFAVPLATHIQARICSDKEYTYMILKDKISMPKTIGFLDPFVEDEYKTYVQQNNIEKIRDVIKENFSFPLIIKRNRGATGNNVFECKSEDEIDTLLSIIFDKKSLHYDYVALAQEKISITEEYRVIILHGKINFAYIKDNSNAVYEGNLSPLHWKGAKAILLDSNDERLKRLQSLVDILYKEFPIPYTGLDVALTTDGQLELIEMNSHPAFGHFIADNGDEKVVGLYKDILLSIMNSRN